MSSSLEYITKQLDEDEPFNTAMKQMDTFLVTTASDLIKEIYPYKSGIIETPKDLTLLLEKQFTFSIYTIAYQLDVSGFSNAIGLIAPKIFADFSFTASDEFQKAELNALENYGINASDITYLCELADKYKHELFEKMNVRGFSLRDVFNDPTRGTSAAGTTLVGADIGFVLTPEPLISKGVAAASFITGIIANIFGD